MSVKSYHLKRGGAQISTSGQSPGMSQCDQTASMVLISKTKYLLIRVGVRLKYILLQHDA